MKFSYFILRKIVNIGVFSEYYKCHFNVRRSARYFATIRDFYTM